MLLLGQVTLDVPPERTFHPALEQVVSLEDLVSEIGHEDGGK